MDQTAPPDLRPDLRLSDRPAWGYLLRDFLEMYRIIPAGGSAKIRAHQRLVREKITAVLRADPPLRPAEGSARPVTTHLQRALDQGRAGAMSRVIRSIDGLAGQLSWQYGYEKVPRGLDQKYAYAELLGPTGPVTSDQIILGLVFSRRAAFTPITPMTGLPKAISACPARCRRMIKACMCPAP
jgi:dimethylpropiothetin dethiomethylase